jgi:tRNA threonylcarbamoyladenosine biosynthesis protein TsaB
MKILGIETTAKIASIALVLDGEVLCRRAFAAKMTLNQRLAPEIVEMLGGLPRDAGLNAVAVGIGPGSFTGVRMGVALAKAMAHALELPLAGVSAPEALATAAGASHGTAICVLQRARAEELYATALTIGPDGIAEEAGPTRVLTLPEALQAAEQSLGRAPEMFAGDAALALAEQIRDACPAVAIAGEEQQYPDAAIIARIAEARPDRLGGDAALGLTPRYVRASQAERQFGVDLGLRG